MRYETGTSAAAVQNEDLRRGPVCVCESKAVHISETNSSFSCFLSSLFSYDNFLSAFAKYILILMYLWHMLIHIFLIDYEKLTVFQKNVPENIEHSLCPCQGNAHAEQGHRQWSAIAFLICSDSHQQTCA